MMRRSTISAFLVIPLLTGASLVAWAAPASGDAPSTNQADVEADALFQKGSEAIDAGKLDKAYGFLTAAWKLKRTHDIAGNLAQVELALGKKRDAAEHIAFALANFPPSVRGDRRDKMKKALDALRKDLAVLRVAVSVADAKVTIDGALIGSSPLPAEVFVTPGAHVLEATLNGYQAATARTEAQSGGAHDVTLTLVRLPEPPPVPPGSGGPAGASKPVIVTGAVLGGVGVILGSVFAGISSGKANDAEAASGKLKAHACASAPTAQCQTLHSLNASSDTFHNAALPLLIAGGAVSAATVVYALWPREKPERAGAIRAVPVAGLGSGGLWFTGNF